MKLMRLTPNKRLADYLIHSEKNTEDCISILPIQVWLEETYLKLMAEDKKSWPYLLNSTEQRIIWENIIESENMSERLLKTHLTARLALDAWNLSYQWCLEEQETFFQTEDVQLYQAWAKKYKKMCADNHWTDSVQMLDLLMKALKKNQIKLPEQIKLLGFDEFMPRISLLFDVIRSMGVMVKSSSLLSERGLSYQMAVKDPDSELRLAAELSQQYLRRARKDLPPKIGIVVPDLEHRRDEIHRIFKETFLEEEFNISAPIPLLSYPLVEAALLGLKMLLHEIDLETLSKFLRSPFFGKSLQEQNPRALWDVFLREQGESYFSLESLFSKVEHQQKEKSFDLPQLLEQFKNLLQLRTLIRGKATSIEWSKVITQILEHLGWPGDRCLNSHEYQIKKCWDQVFNQYSGLDHILQKHTYAEALAQINRLVCETLFLPQSPKANIQILGLLEALDLPFDVLWVTGMSREAWPKEPMPNPFIPINLQKTLDMPRSSAARELRVAKRLTEKFCRGAKTVIFSFAQSVEDRVNQPSTLIQMMKAIQPKDLNLSLPQSYLSKIAGFRKNDLQPEENNIVLPKHAHNERIYGGIQALKLQSLCPFRAFAEIRLTAKPIPKTSMGLKPFERGEIVHEVLLKFWQNIPDQASLLKLDQAQVNLQIHSAIDETLAVWVKRRPRTLKPQYVRLEKARIFSLIDAFIQLEKTRAPFTVYAKEIEQMIMLNNLPFKVRIDRIDRLADGQEILIDYKTGEVSIADWFGERPKDPQLPIYCTTRESLPFGVAFGLLRPEGSRFNGILKEEGVVPGGKTVQQAKRFGSEDSYEAQCASWRQTLENLADNFNQGDVRVDPLEGENTCRLCSLKTLCRVRSTGLF